MDVGLSLFFVVSVSLLGGRFNAASLDHWGFGLDFDVQCLPGIFVENGEEYRNRGRLIVHQFP